MSNLGSILEGGVIGVAVGGAAAAVVEPALEPARQEAEKESQARILNLAQLAQLVAQSLQTLDEVLDDAHRNGYHDDQLAAAVQLALRAPGVPEALSLYRRRNMQEGGAPFTLGQLHRAYAKAQIEADFWPALDSLADLPLDPAVIANAIVRGIIPAPFPLPYTPPTGTGNVQSFPQSTLDAAKEAAASGTNVDRLFVETAIAGRPMAPEEAAKAQFRSILQPDDYLRAILEGDIRGEWADAIREYTREILTAHDHVELRLRGWYGSDAEMYAGTAQHGMTQANTDLLFKVLGRPISYRNVFLGQRRGGIYAGPVDTVDPAALQSMRESNLRPEWYSLAGALLETKPTLFFVRSWLKDGHDPARAQTWLYELGYSQDDITAIITAYAPGAATGGPNVPDTHLKSSITSTITAIRKKYAAGDLTPDIANQYIQAAESATTLTGIWDVLKSVESVAAPPPQPAPAALIAAVEALGYNVTPPAPPVPAEVSELEALGYTVTPK